MLGKEIKVKWKVEAKHVWTTTDATLSQKGLSVNPALSRVYTEPLLLEYQLDRVDFSKKTNDI